MDARHAELFDGLYRRHHQAVFRACLRFAGGDRAWAMDRVHDVFVRLARELDHLDTSEDLGGWLYRVAVNACLMELRRQRGFGALRERVADFLRPRAGRGPEGEVRTRRDATRLERALARLPDKQRAVIVAIELEGKSGVEVARLLGLSEGQVSKLRSKALATLRGADWERGDE